MAENDNPDIFITVAGERLQLILPGYGWTFEEAKLAKAVSEGMAPIEIERGLELADPDAWLAVLRVSYLRANQEYPAAKISDTDILELANDVGDAIRGARKGVPPTSVNGSESLSSGEPSESEPAASPS